MLDSLDIAVRNKHIVDGGPYYHEFIVDSFVKEPWNAFSSLLFFVPIVYWMVKLKGSYRSHLVIMAILPLLFLNGLGSTLYHAFRSHWMFLYLDFIPASMMSLLLSLFFWTKVSKSWKKAVLVVSLFYLSGFLALEILLRFEAWKEMGPNIAYFFVGASFFVPIVIILVKTRCYKIQYVVFTFVFLILALICRITDHPSDKPFPDTLPQGTHFLWHVFTVLAVFSMGYFVYFLNLYKRED